MYKWRFINSTAIGWRALSLWLSYKGPIFYGEKE